MAIDIRTSLDAINDKNQTEFHLYGLLSRARTEKDKHTKLKMYAQGISDMIDYYSRCGKRGFVVGLDPEVFGQSKGGMGNG